MSTTKKKWECAHTHVSEVIEYLEYSENLISMLVIQKENQGKKLHPTSIYVGKWFT